MAYVKQERDSFKTTFKKEFPMFMKKIYNMFCIKTEIILVTQKISFSPVIA